MRVSSSHCVVSNPPRQTMLFHRADERVFRAFVAQLRGLGCLSRLRMSELGMSTRGVDGHARDPAAII